MTIDPRLRGRCRQTDVIESILARLIAGVTGYSDQNCFFSDDPIPAHHKGGDQFCTVSTGSGTFPTEMYGGGGTDTTTEQASIVVSPSIPWRGERMSNRASRRLLRNRDPDDTYDNSLVARKEQILSVLLADSWEPNRLEVEDPLDPANNIYKPLLRDLIRPVSCSAPGEINVGEAVYLQIRLVFETVFDWELS